MKFKETKEPTGVRRSQPHPHSHTAPQAGDHRAWSAYWGEQCLSAMRWAEAHPHLEAKEALEHVERSARLAWFHACKLKGYTYWKPEALGQK